MMIDLLTWNFGRECRNTGDMGIRLADGVGDAGHKRRRR